MNVTGHHIDDLVREDRIGPSGHSKSYWRKERADGIPSTTGVVNKTNLRVWPNSMNISDNILLAHYQRERR